MNKEQTKIRKMAYVSLLAACCYVGFAYLKIDIPVGASHTAIHFGNTFCVLAALLFGGVSGGLAGAIGMGIGDLLDPRYIASFPKTFVLKFGIGCICGMAAKKLNIKDNPTVARVALAASSGMIFNIIMEPIVSFLYKNYILGVEYSAAKMLAYWTAGATFFNAITSVVIATALYMALYKVVKKANIVD